MSEEIDQVTRVKHVEALSLMENDDVQFTILTGIYEKYPPPEHVEGATDTNVITLMHSTHVIPADAEPDPKLPQAILDFVTKVRA